VWPIEVIVQINKRGSKSLKKASRDRHVSIRISDPISKISDVRVGDTLVRWTDWEFRVLGTVVSRTTNSRGRDAILLDRQAIFRVLSKMTSNDLLEMGMFSVPLLEITQRTFSNLSIRRVFLERKNNASRSSSR
jgi:hypothetical protein